MTRLSVEAYATVPRLMDIGSCTACNLFWFDQSASIRLTPTAVLGLFEHIGRAGAPNGPLASRFNCPRCRHPLDLIHDLQRSTRFTYWRCPNDQGQLLTFGQFLAEKNFIRPPSDDELAKLRAMLRQINCSQCGAPINLETDAACPHCGAAVALIDADAVSKALHDLATTGATPPSSPSAPTRTTLSDVQLDALFDLQRIRPHEGGDDLLAIGAEAIGAVLGTWLSSR
jgi:hypothetical protein